MKNIENSGAVRSVAKKLAGAGALALWIGLGVGAPAYAQSADQSAPVEQVVVTGSRVVSNGASSPTPLTVISGDQLAQINPNLVVDALTKLPSLDASTNRNSIGSSTAAGPGAFLNMRGLGAQRTLVLLNGTRMVPDTSTATVDVSMIPSELLKRVDVVTGGASAAYGSDAISGVVNFVLDTDYTGFKGSASGGISEYGDVPKAKLDFAYGTSLLNDRLHIVASADYFGAGGIQGAQGRSYLNRNCDPIPNPAVTGANPASLTNPTLLMKCNTTLPYATYGGLIVGGPLNFTQFGPGGTPEAFHPGTLRSSTEEVGGDGANLAPYGNYTVPVQEGSVFSRATYDITPDMHAFVQFFGSTNGSNYVETYPYQDSSTAFTVFSDNAYLPAATLAQMQANHITNFKLGRVDTDWKPIETYSGYRSYDFTAGLNGTLWGDWSWDVGYEQGLSDGWVNIKNNINVVRVYQAADAVYNSSGQIVCRDPANGCVPLDLFGVGASSQAAQQWISGTLWSRQELAQQVASANIKGEPFSLWAGPVSFAAGVEYREEKGVQTVDPISSSAVDTTGIMGVPTSVATAPPGGWQTNNPKPLKGKYDDFEAYFEALVPLAHDEWFAKSLDLNLAGRITDYSTSGPVETYKVGVTYQPYGDDLKLRFTDSRDIRAPNVSELFSGTAQSRPTIIDPLNNNQSVTGVLALRLGNPNLLPEQASTLSYGFVYQPSWLSGLTFSVDYYNIGIHGEIGQPAPQDVVTFCADGNAAYCGLVTRVNGQITQIETPSLNLARTLTRGDDVELDYTTDLADIFLDIKGIFSFRALGTYVAKQTTTTPTAAGTVTVDRAGDISSSQPRWVVFNSVSYENGPVALTVTGRYVGAGHYNNTYNSVGYNTGFIDNNNIPSLYYVGLTTQYTLQSMFATPRLFFHVENLFDQAPPPVPGTNFEQLQTNPSLYDVEGRSFMFGVDFEL